MNEATHSVSLGRAARLVGSLVVLGLTAQFAAGLEHRDARAARGNIQRGRARIGGSAGTGGTRRQPSRAAR